MARRHLVTVWDPTLGPDVIQMHLRVLLDVAERCRKGDCTSDDVYVWWAKLHSPNRPQALPHLADVLRVAAAEDGDASDEETHLFLTDYRSLYVAHIAEVTERDPREDQKERAYVPDYYLGGARIADCWFRLWDIRRLVADDTVAVVHELKNLLNTRYHDRPVSIYGGMVELPLIVTEAEPREYFDTEYRDHLTGQPLWAEFDAEQAGVRSLERDLRENLFGDDVWLRLNPLARAFIATAEKIYRDHADDPAFDLSPVIVQLSKALEVTCRGIIEPLLDRAEPGFLEKLRAKEIRVDWSNYHPSLSDLGQILHEMGQDGRGRARLPARDSDWLSKELPSLLARLARARGPKAHAESGTRQLASEWRRVLLGIGCEGVLVRLAKVGSPGTA